ncbi:MAG: hypothetical protein QOI74_2636 [Micromonosporaceae bacterium]|nr:hypothetical protein [Micromonosporaceae bacterium]
MRLIVGPLPPAVYWRRRVVIVGALLVLLLIVVYSCANVSDASGRKRVLSPSIGSSPSASRPASTSPVSPSAGVAGPDADPPIDADPGTDGTPDPAGSADPAGTTAGTGPCTDAEMTVTAAADPASAARAALVKFTLRIKNIAARSCTRDVGADPQELYLQDTAKQKVWSSDSCDPAHGTDVRMFRPGDVAEFYVTWSGRTNQAGCADQPFVAAGGYQLVGRLATKLSEPTLVTRT